MNTVFLLLAKYERSPVPLNEVCEEFFGIGEKHASMLAASQSLPIPVFKLRESERAKWMVDIRDLAEHIDKKRRQALHDYIDVRTN
ncbi:pyocin activator PrtN family protein [Shewanella sp.]|uniref:pyocin activator PrtN family protein n=1 Tax=Shewanella sp. TaxID=50422 RepID=UPI0035683E22